jgi:hypothetical protein
MINDYQDELTTTVGPPVTSKQSIVGTAGTAIIGGKVKDGGAAGDWGAGETYAARLRCVDALSGATGGLQVDIVTDSNSNLTTAPVVLATKTIPAASLVANSVFMIGLIQPGTRKRYLGVKLTPLSTNSTTGTVIVFLGNAEDSSPQNRVNSI